MISIKRCDLEVEGTQVGGLLMLTIGNEGRTALRVTRGQLDAQGCWHPWRPDVFPLWRGCRYGWRELRDRAAAEAWIKLAHWLPRKLVAAAAIRFGVHATTGPYSNQVVPELTFLEALQRWGH